MELPIRMKTAEEMHRYCLENGLGRAFGNSGLRSFTLAERLMEPDEEAFLTFIGLHRFHSMSAHQRNFAYAFTNKRILMCQVRSFWRTRHESVPLNSVMNLSFDSDNVVGVMKIMLANDAVTVGMSQEAARNLSDIITRLLPLIQELAHGLEDRQTD